MELNVKNIAAVAITSVLMVVLASAVLIPALTGAQESLVDSELFSNESDTRLFMTPIDASTTTTLVVDSTGIISGGESIDYWEGTGIYNSVLVSDSFCMVSTGAALAGMDVTTKTALAGTSCTISIDAGSITYSIGDVTSTIPFTQGYIASKTGSYVTVYSPDPDKYFESSDQISGWRQSSGDCMVFLNGKGYLNGAEISSAHVTSSEVEGTDGTVQQLDSVTFNNRSINYLVLPATAEYTHTDHPAELALISVIPLLIFVGIILSTIATVLMRRE